MRHREAQPEHNNGEDGGWILLELAVTEENRRVTPVGQKRLFVFIYYVWKAATWLLPRKECTFSSL